MKISVISDIHIHPDNDKGINTLKKFLGNSIVLKSDLIILLGDIFDLMVYDFNEYNDLYKESLEEIQKVLDSGVRVIFVEGNHDFCVGNFLKRRFQQRKFHHFKDGFKLEANEKKLVFFHGDTIEINNKGYKLYRFLIKSLFIQNFYQKMLGFRSVWKIGSYFLEKSHDRHLLYSSGFENKAIKNKFRESAKSYFKKNNINYLICGHSHMKDIFKFNESIYLNNGYAQSENTFLYFDGSGFSFLSL